jgi:endonuclease/exonuclease/phosphatase family metal-dependent hydrolase
MRNKQFSGQRVIFFLVLVFPLILISCTRCVLPSSDKTGDEIVFMSYNVQNIFDDSDNGTEYSEFDPSNSDWGTSQYNTRLFNLSEVIRRSISGGPDVIALQEIENYRVAEDLVSAYLKGMGYKSIIVTDTEGSAIQLGIISRIELADVKVHQIIENGRTIGRPILEAVIHTDISSVYIFNNHWKSKLGGAEETEPDRIASAAFLKRRISELHFNDPLVEIVVFGDLNENWDEYNRISGSYVTALIPYEINTSSDISGSIKIITDSSGFPVVSAVESLIMFSPWDENSSANGSYVYNDSWETIDHMLLNSSMFNNKGYDYRNFSVMSENFLTDVSGRPFAWKTETGYGYSDHLPLLLVLEKQEGE